MRRVHNETVETVYQKRKKECQAASNDICFNIQENKNIKASRSPGNILLQSPTYNLHAWYIYKQIVILRS